MTDAMNNDANKMQAHELTERLACNVANIVGESPAAARALRLLADLRASGRAAHIEHHGDSWLVVQEDGTHD